MALFRIETVTDTRTGLVYIEAYYPSEADQPFVTSDPMYRSHEEAQDAALEIFQSGLPVAVEKA